MQPPRRVPASPRASLPVSARVARVVRAGLVALALASLSSLAGCSKVYIPNTDVEDNSENRGVIEFCEKYRHAIEDKNVGQLLKMMSPAYFEDGGNTKNTDDADYDKIREFLTSDFLHTSGVRYEIRYRKVKFSEREHIFVDYTYLGAWKVPGTKQDEWHHTTADNELDLVRDGDSFKIVKGM